MKKIFILLLVSFFYQVNAQLDANGWTILNPSNTSKIIYVSSSEGQDNTGEVYANTSAVLGNNPIQPTGTIKPFKTIAAAVSKVNNGGAVWILLKKSDVFYESLITKNGESLNRPFVYSCYGTGNQLPLLKTGNKRGFSQCCKSFAHFHVIGLSFYAHTRNPNDDSYVNSEGESGLNIYTGEGHEVNNVLIEGCVFRFYTNNIIQGPGNIINIKLRRNLILDNYSETGHSQGLYGSGIEEIILEDNIFDHNGWYKQSYIKLNDKKEGQATFFNHNTYFAGNKNVTFINNSFYRPSSIGTKWTANDGEASTSNVILTNNLYYDYEVGISMGGNDIEPPYRFKDILVNENVFCSPGVSKPTNRILGWTMEINDWDDGEYIDNYIINQVDPGVTHGLAVIIQGQNRNLKVEGNILYNLNETTHFTMHDIDFKNTSIANNTIVSPLSENKYLYRLERYTNLSELDVQDNYYAIEAENNQEFGNHNKNKIPFSSITQILGENDAVNHTTDPGFLDPTRTVERYVKDVLGLTDMNAFYKELRKQSYLNWREEYTTNAINSWIKEGFKIETVTNVQEESSHAISVYPNPVQSMCSIKGITSGTLQIFTTTGQLILTHKIHKEESLDLSELTPGMYVLQMMDEGRDKIVTELIIKE